MDFIEATIKQSLGSIYWAQVPYQLKAICFVEIVGVTTDGLVSSEIANIPNTKSSFLLECQDLTNHSIFIISDGETWELVKRTITKQTATYRIIPTKIHLTTTDQGIIIKLLQAICEDAIPN